MELKQLEYFRTVARMENISKAASLLHITQPALSKSITRLEQEIGVELFERSDNRIHLNQAGALFLERVDLIVSQLRSGVDELKSIQPAKHGHIHIGTFTAALVSAPMQKFMAENPFVTIRHSVLSQEQLCLGLEQGEIDIAVSLFEMESRRLTWTPVAQDELIVLVLADSPLAAQPMVRLSDLQNQRILLADSTQGMRVRTLLEGFCAKAGFTPNIAYEGPDSDLAMNLLREGNGVFIIPASIHIWKVEYDHTPSQDGQQTRFERPFPFAAMRIVDPVCEFRYGLAVSKERVLSVAALEMYRKLTNYFESYNRLLSSTKYEKLLLL